MPEKLIKSKKRVKEFGEVFTPEFIVRQMCDLCEPEISKIDGKVFEPTCGNGNFLVEILRRKLAKIKKPTAKNPKKPQRNKFEFEVILALSNIYAVDIQADNVFEARDRLKEIIFEFVSDVRNSAQFLLVLDKILEKTIIVGNTLTQKSELIFYDFKPNFENLTFEISSHSLQEIEETYAKTRRASLETLGDILDRKNPLEIPEKRKSTSKKKTSSKKEKSAESPVSHAPPENSKTSPPKTKAKSKKNVEQASLF